jgi:hypothetical protein
LLNLRGEGSGMYVLIYRLSYLCNMSIVFLIVLKHHANSVSLQIAEWKLNYLGKILRWKVQV